MNSDPFSDLSLSAPEAPCDCHDSPSPTSDSAGGLPSLDELDAQLSAVLQAPASFDAELDLGLLGDDDPANLELLALQDLPGSELPSIEGIIELAQRYPGLKITLSF